MGRLLRNSQRQQKLLLLYDHGVGGAGPVRPANTIGIARLGVFAHIVMIPRMKILSLDSATSYKFLSRDGCLSLLNLKPSVHPPTRGANSQIIANAAVVIRPYSMATRRLMRPWMAFCDRPTTL